MTFWALSASSRVALVFGTDPASSRTVSYADLAEGADDCATWIAQDGKALGLILCPAAEMPIRAYLAALWRGDAVILLSEQTPAVKLAVIVERYQPDWILQPAAGEVPPDYRADRNQDGFRLLRRRVAVQPAPHKDLAVMLSTSGTTGSPKMVRLSYANIASNARSIVEYLGIRPESRAITTLPFAYSYGMSIINSYFAAGASIVVTEAGLMSRPFWDAFAFHKVTSLAGVPYTYQMLHRLDPRKLPLDSLDTLTQAGGRLANRLIDYFRVLSEERRWRFFVMYGQTEASPRISYVPPEMLATKVGSIGVPIPGGRLSLSEQGELVYEGPNVMMGYAESRADIGRDDEMGGRLATGDLASVDADGYFTLHGRLKRMTKIHGNRISLDDVEHHLEMHLANPVAVTGEEDRLHVFVTAESDAALVGGTLTSTFHLHHTTFTVKTIDSIPLSSSGKKDYALLGK